MKFENGDIVFSSGRKAYCNAGIVGIDSDLGISYGYDGGIDWPPSDWEKENCPVEALTNEDMQELADHMIGLWSKFRDSLKR